MENQKQPFASVAKIAAENVYKIHRKTPVQESPFDKFAYLKPGIPLKKRLQQPFAVSFFNFSGQLFLITSQNDHFCLHISTK